MKVTCFSTVSEKNLAYAHFQERIAASENETIRCKRSYNALNNTARLPDELLAEVFIWNLVIRYKVRPFGEYCTEVAAVCSHWRRVALNCPRLWTTFYLDRKIDWLTEVVIPRSQQAPLNVELTLMYQNISLWERIPVTLGDNYHRIQNLSLRNTKDDLSGSQYSRQQLNRLLSSFTRAMPILRSFAAVFRGGSQYDLPRHLFGNMTPNLRTIELVSCRTFEAIPDLSTITSLTLGNCPDHTRPLSLRQLMAFVKAAPNLNNLELRRICFPPPASDLDCGSFPTIQTLVIQDGSRECFVLLSCISCPQVQRIDIETDFYPGINATQELIDLLVSYIRIDRLALLSRYNSVLFQGILTADATKKLEITLSLHEIYVLLESLSTPLSCLSLLKLEILPPSSLLDNTFSTMRNLKTLHLRGFDIHDITAILFPNIGFEALLVWFSKVALNPDMSNGGLGEEMAIGKRTLSSVAQANMRFKSIQRLIITNSIFTASDITVLAATFHLRYMLGITLEELRVVGHAHNLSNAHREVSWIITWICKGVKTLYWDVGREAASSGQ